MICDEIRQIVARIVGEPMNSGWDSLQHLEILLTIEDRYGFRFSTDEMTQLLTVEALVDRVEPEGTADPWPDHAQSRQ